MIKIYSVYKIHSVIITLGRSWATQRPHANFFLALPPYYFKFLNSLLLKLYKHLHKLFKIIFIKYGFFIQKNGYL